MRRDRARIDQHAARNLGERGSLTWVIDHRGGLASGEQHVRGDVLNDCIRQAMHERCGLAHCVHGFVDAGGV